MWPMGLTLTMTMTLTFEFSRSNVILTLTTHMALTMDSCISEWEGRLTLYRGGWSRLFTTMTVTIWWPRLGLRIYQLVTGVTSHVGVPSTPLVHLNMWIYMTVSMTMWHYLNVLFHFSGILYCLLAWCTSSELGWGSIGLHDSGIVRTPISTSLGYRQFNGYQVLYELTTIRACCPGGHYCSYCPGALSLNYCNSFQDQAHCPGALSLNHCNSFEDQASIEGTRMVVSLMATRVTCPIGL